MLAPTAWLSGWDCVGVEGGDVVLTSEAESCARRAALRASSYGMSDFIIVSNSR